MARGTTESVDAERQNAKSGPASSAGPAAPSPAETAAASPDGPPPEPLQARRRYNRAAAVRYALRHWNSPNPRFANMDTFGAGGDCANFVSQCLLAGGWPLDYRESAVDREWWYRRMGTEPFDRNRDDWWSCTWAVADSHLRYMRANHGQVLLLSANPRLARLLRLGDVIYYDWDGDEVFTHSAIVTGFTRAGSPLVTYRTLSPRRPVRNALWTLRFRGRARIIAGMRLTSTPVVHDVRPNFTRLRPCDRTRLP